MFKYLFLFVLALSAFLVATLPVNLLLPYVPKSVPISITGAQGTVWKGSATQVSWNRQPLGQLEWEVHPVRLLLLHLNTDFKLSGDGLHASGNATLKRNKSVLLINTLFDADIAKLPLPSQAMMVTPEGRVNASIRSLYLENQKIDSADADILWDAAKITSPAAVEMGQMMLKVSGKNGNLEGVLDSKDGPIKAAGKLNIDPQGMLKANIQLIPNASTPAEIRDLLPMIGRPDRNGAVTINQKLKIPGWPA